MKPKPILVLPEDISTESIQEAKDSGYLVILSNNPEAIKVVSTDFAVNDFFMAALNALASKKYSIEDARSAFVFELQARLEEKEIKESL